MLEQKVNRVLCYGIVSVAAEMAKLIDEGITFVWAPFTVAVNVNPKTCRGLYAVFAEFPDAVQTLVGALEVGGIVVKIAEVLGSTQGETTFAWTNLHISERQKLAPCTMRQRQVYEMLALAGFLIWIAETLHGKEK